MISGCVQINTSPWHCVLPAFLGFDPSRHFPSSLRQPRSSAASSTRIGSPALAHLSVTWRVLSVDPSSTRTYSQYLESNVCFAYVASARSSKSPRLKADERTETFSVTTRALSQVTPWFSENNIGHGHRISVSSYRSRPGSNEMKSKYRSRCLACIMQQAIVGLATEAKGERIDRCIRFPISGVYVSCTRSRVRRPDFWHQ
jgi:hypothetical protein